jgi:hypothetical protein
MALAYKKQQLSDVYNGIDNSQGINNMNHITSGIAKGLDNMADNLQKEKEHEYNNSLLIFKTEVNAQLKKSMGELYSAIPNDPVKLEKEFANLKSKILNGIGSDDVKLSAEINYIALSENYLFTAEENRKKFMDLQTKQSISENINNPMQPIANFYGGMYRGTLTPEAIVDMKFQRKQAEELLQTRGVKKDPITNEYIKLFGDEEIEEYKKQSQLLKVTEGFSFFNGLFEEDKNEFSEVYSLWEQNPKTIRENYSLTNDEYKKILANAKALNNVLGKLENDNDLRGNSQAKQAYAMLETGLSVILEDKKQTEDFFKNKKNKSLDYLADYGQRLEIGYAQGFIREKDYNSYNDLFRKSYLGIIKANIKDVENVGSFRDSFFAKTSLQRGIAIINDNTSDFRDVDRQDLYSKLLQLANERNIDLNSVNKGTKGEMEKLANGLAAEYCHIDPSGQDSIERIRRKRSEQLRDDAIRELNDIAGAYPIKIDSNRPHIQKSINKYVNKGRSYGDAKLLAEEEITNKVKTFMDEKAEVGDFIQREQKRFFKNIFSEVKKKIITDKSHE